MTGPSESDSPDASKLRGTATEVGPQKKKEEEQSPRLVDSGCFDNESGGTPSSRAASDAKPKAGT